MRPAKTSQSSLEAPLNRILGTEANVRLLRVLVDASEPVSRPDVARRAQLDASGVRRSLDALALEGVVEAVGPVTRTCVRLRDVHPLAPAIRALFAAERARAEEVVQAVRDAADRLSIQPTAVWISTSAQADGVESLAVGVVASARQVGGVVRELRRALDEVQRIHGLLIDIQGYTAADLETLSAERRQALMTARAVLGPEPFALLPEHAPAASREQPPEGHARLDRRALILAKAIGDRIARDPTLIVRAREYALRVAAQVPGAREELEEWVSILDALPAARLRAFLADPGERATRLRQSLPFVHVLTPAERADLLRKAEDDARAA